MLVTTLLNHVEKYKSFVYDKVGWSEDQKSLEVHVRPRSNSRPVCSGCGCPASRYGHTREERRFRYVPLWKIPVYFLYRMRRVNCPRCGVKVEQVPWSQDGKSPRTKSWSWFLAAWAKRMSWKETADVFETSWQTVFRSIRFAVYWGLVHVDFSGVEAIGIDEIARRKGHRYMTLIYQIDGGKKRLLYVARERTKPGNARKSPWHLSSTSSAPSVPGNRSSWSATCGSRTWTWSKSTPVLRCTCWTGST